MESPKINFLSELFDKKSKGKKTGKKTLSLKLFFYPFIFLFIFFVVFTCQIIFSGNSIIDTISKMNIFSNYSLAVSKDKLLNGEKEDRINILLLGMGGEGHPGPYLTDTIILASLKPSENKITLISIPRDLSIPIPGYGWRKINNANHFGEIKEPGQGAKYASDVVSQLLNIPVHYYVRVDFSGFEKLIDELGGIKVTVDNSFVDNQFPTNDYGYQTVSFTAGVQKMDGQTALNFARSRHGSNGENSDFARSKRQQKVLQAIKEKALSFSTFLSYNKISALFELYHDHVSTNLQMWEIFKFAQMAKNFDSSKITNIVLDNGPDGLLYSTNIGGAYLLLPKDMSFGELRQVVKNALEPAATTQPQELVKLEIQNGTKIEGLAYKTSLELKKTGYKVIKIGNAQIQNYEKTIIYDLTRGQKDEALEDLKSKFGADIYDQLPENLNIENDIDFLIILGQNLNKTAFLSQ
jgi:LCP family protein required for cell wall assembly